MPYQNRRGKRTPGHGPHRRRPVAKLKKNKPVEAEMIRLNSTYGFARPQGADSDVFIPGKYLMGAMPGDQVLLRVQDSEGTLKEGQVIKILQEAQITFTGSFHMEEGRPVVHPDKQLRFPIAIERGHQGGAQVGDKVLCSLSHRGSSHFEHRAVVSRVFGSSDSAASCCEAVLAAEDIRRNFPDLAQAEAQNLAQSDIHPKELAVRLDLRDQCIFTIDSADSKDLDDAVSLARRPDGGWTLGVHIADVSYYIKAGSELEKEAFRRGTSIYYADQVVPMLPPEISNGTCSLHPGEDKLTLSALIQLAPSGAIERYEFRKTVIRSRIKGVYSEINAILAGQADDAILAKYHDLIPMIQEMQQLAHALVSRRRSRGAVDLSSVESKIILDISGRAVDIKPRSQGISEGIIEEFMLTANQCAADYGLTHQLPFVYRTHDQPAPDRIQVLDEILGRLGLPSVRADEKGEVGSAGLQAILEQVRHSPLERIVNNQILRSMAKAQYAPDCTGHFGLVLEKYSHFTSPIRRYPDLIIHRIMSAHITGMKRENIEKRFRSFVAEAAKHSTATEIQAMTIERDCTDIYKAEYMKERVGQQFEGIISSIVSHGMYIQLPNTVEGLIHLDRLPAGKYVIPSPIELVEQIGNTTYRVGDAIAVALVSAEVSSGRIDFEIAGNKEN